MTRLTSRAGLLTSLGLVALLGGCAMYDDDIASYGRYNGSIGVGVGAGYGYGYADGYGYGPGWYDGFYYPGSGLWAYDRAGRRHRWQQGGHRRDGDRGWAGGRPAPGAPPTGVVDGRPHRRGEGGWPARGDGGRPVRGEGAGSGRSEAAAPPRRAPDATARPTRAAPIERAPARPTREGRNQQERPD